MLYLFQSEASGIVFKTSEPVDVGREYPRKSEPRWLKIPETGGDRAFVIAAKTIAGGEPKQRQRSEELRQKKSRNLKTEVARASVYLAMMLPRTTTEKGAKVLNIEEAEKLLTGLLPEVKAALGWPSANPVEWSYRIEDEVLEAAPSPAARKMLEREIPHGIILPERLARIEDRFRLELGEEAEAVLSALRESATRDHLALISLGGDRDERARISMTDEDKNRLLIPAWKLVDLLEHPGVARKLYVFPADYARDRYPEVLFNEEIKGDLVGKYDPAESTLRVLVVAVNEAAFSRRADPASRPVTFFLDQDYLVCLWLVLRRIIGDRRRYEELLEKAEAQTQIDPFNR